MEESPSNPWVELRSESLRPVETFHPSTSRTSTAGVCRKTEACPRAKRRDKPKPTAKQKTFIKTTIPVLVRSIGPSTATAG